MDYDKDSTNVTKKEEPDNTGERWTQPGPPSSPSEAWLQPPAGGRENSGIGSEERQNGSFTDQPEKQVWEEKGSYKTQYRAREEEQPQKKNSMAIASLVMGGISLITCCCSWLGVMFGALGIMFALLSRADEPMCSHAKTGLVLSIVGVSLSLIMVILMLMMNLYGSFGEVLLE